MSKARNQQMTNISPITTRPAEATGPVVQETASQTVGSTVAAQALIPPTPQLDAMPSIEELLARNRQLEEEKAEAVANAEGFRLEFEKLKARSGQPPEMTTTTTKPVWPYIVKGPPGVEKFDVVDEGEAKRLYCVKHKIDPSTFALEVKCEDPQRRNASITRQYQEANRHAAERAKGMVDETRVPGVHIGV